ncbi:MAG: hypothetical protein GY852_10035 [bacterium]|nr:hypothetical protein [bacterium]
MKKSYLIILLVLLLYGCIDHSYYVTEGGEVIRTKAINVTDLVACDPADTGCVCMVCETTGPDLFNPFTRFYGMDLQDAQCRFQAGCSEQVFRDFYPDPTSTLSVVGSNVLDMIFGSEQVRFFMFGQGSNFAEFVTANRFCNNSMRLSVRWLSSTSGYEYPLPQPERAECFLEKDVLPMYLLHSEGTAMEDIPHVTQLAATFVDSGPVILSSEFDFDPKNLSQLDGAIDQSIAMKQACPNCIIAISPRLEYDLSLDPNDKYIGYNNTYDAIDYIFNESPRKLEALQSIDIVGVGLNSHYAKNCVGASLLWDGYEYSQYVMQTYEKPTIWAYVLLDVNESNVGGLEFCNWTPDEVVKTYSDIYTYVPALIRAGVLGVAPYSLYGVDSGPLECENCGMMNVDGTVYPQHTLWFSNCQIYYTSRGLTPIVYSPNPCADCSYANNYNMFQLDTTYLGFSPDSTHLQGEEVQPFERFYICSGQLMTEVPEEIDLSGYIPNIDDSDDPDSTCELYPELDIFSDIRDMDPVLTRSFTFVETGFNDPTEGPGGDMCSASIVSASQCSEKPNGGCLDVVLDPIESGGICGPQYTNDPQKRFHSLGLMQTHTYPYTQWADGGSDDYRPEAEWCGKDEFNPFNKAHNACLGTAIILDKIKNGGRPVVSSNEWRLGLNSLKEEYGEDSHEYLNMKNAYTIFISSYYYSGFITMHSGNRPGRELDGWIADFNAQRAINEADCYEEPGSTESGDTGTSEMPSEFDEECCGDGEIQEGPCCNQKNFINYLRHCKFPELSTDAQPKAAYGLKLLGVYTALLECDKYDEAEAEQNLIDYMASYGDEIEEEPPEEEGETEGP